MVVKITKDIYRESENVPWIVAGKYHVKREFDAERYMIYLLERSGKSTLVRKDECELMIIP